MPARKKAPPAEPITVERVESRRDKFMRLAQPRMKSCLKQIRLLGNLASPTYEWHEGDIAKMYATLQTAIEDHFARFKKEKPAKFEETFSFEKSETV